MFQDYLDLLPEYQDVSSLEGLTCVRPFFGFVPNWIDSPLQPMTSRLLHFGDSAGNRSQLSFAGQHHAIAQPSLYVLQSPSVAYCDLVTREAIAFTV